MNGGTNRGQADGFQLSVLNKIKDVKTQVGKSTLNTSKNLVCIKQKPKCQIISVFSYLTAMSNLFQDNEANLMKYIVQVYCDKRHGGERGDFNLPDPYSILAAAQVN